MPHIVGPYRIHVAQPTRWSVIAAYSGLVVMFDCMAERNTQVSDGGVAQHRMSGNLQACAEAGVEFASISPPRRDTSDVLGAEWMPPRPGTDTALMMGLAHTLLTVSPREPAILDRYTVGVDRVRVNLSETLDGQVKEAA